MRIVREKHPLKGQALRVLGRMHREGSLQLVLSLPDGGTSLIPAAWTDLNGATPLRRSARVLGRVADLMHTRRAVDALLRRQDTAGTGPVEKEDGEWYRLLDFCGVTDTLIGDEVGSLRR